MHNRQLKQEKSNDKTKSNMRLASSFSQKTQSFCGSCRACKRLSRPGFSSDTASSVLSHAKAMGKEFCAVSFMQRNYGNRFTASVLNPVVQKKCSCGGSCSRCKGEEEAGRISMSIMKMSGPLISYKPSVISYQPSVNDEQSKIGEIMSNKGSGQKLDDNTSSFMEERFGYNFGSVRIHTDSYAAKKSNELNAEAFTVGRDIFFNAGRYNLSTADGKKLLAHELIHVVQQEGEKGFTTYKCDALQRSVSYDECTPAEETIVLNSHNRAMNMVATAVRKLASYNGTTPADVRSALNAHFHSSGTVLARWISFNLNWLKGEADSPTYECEKPQIGRRLGWSMWCVPWTDIELYPLWFKESDIDKRARTMIHEWVHRYGCNFDLGYEWEQGYSGHGALRSLLNADPWAHFVYDVS